MSLLFRTSSAVILLFLLLALAGGCLPWNHAHQGVRAADAPEAREAYRLKRTMAQRSREWGMLHYIAGREACAKGDFAGALAHMKRAAGMMPRWVLPWLELAHLYRVVEHDLAKVESSLKHALELSGNNPRAHLLLGRIYMQTNRFREAVRHLERAVVLKPHHVDTRKDYARLLIRLHRNREAIAELKWLLARAPQEFSLHTLLVQAHEQLGQVEQACATLERLAFLFPDQLAPQRLLLAFYRRHQMEHKARMTLERIRHLCPEERPRQMRPLHPSRR